MFIESNGWKKLANSKHVKDYHKKLTTKPKVVCTEDVCLMCQ